MNEPIKLKLAPLVALVVGSMVAGGIFSIPQNMAASAAPAATLLAWGITGLGMLALAFVFVSLTLRQPQLDSGVYAYARAAFGPFVGFSSAWGYWLMGVLGNVGYYILLFSTLGHYLPLFGQGNTPWAVAGASALVWCMHFLLLRGIRQAAFVNQIATLAKLTPLALFVLVAVFAFKSDVFARDLWGQGLAGGKPLGSVLVLALLVAVSVLSMGILSQPELAALPNPSMAHVLAHVAGPWGAAFISVGVLVSLSGALLAWLMLASETLFMAARDGTAPHWLTRENAHGAPAAALWLTSACAQAFLLLTLVSEATYVAVVQLGTAMVLLPYTWAALFALRLAWRGQGYGPAESGARRRDVAVAALAVVYALWLLYAGGLKYLLLSCLLYIPGALLYAWARREHGRALFSRREWLFFGALLAMAAVAAAGLKQGWLTL